MNTLLIGAAVEAAWLGAYAVTLLATSPPRPAGNATDASLTPALQTALALRFSDWVSPAVDATFESMTRRGWFEVDGTRIKLGPGDGRPVSQAEQQVLRHVSAVVGKSAERSAPLHVLNEGPGAAQSWEGFREAVIGEGRAGGLVRDRISGAAYYGLVVGGTLAPVAAALLAFEGDSRVAVAICAALFGGGAHAWLVQKTLRKLVLTRAGAAAAGPLRPVRDSPLTASRDNHTGWVPDDQGGWRQWRVQEPPLIRFGSWPIWILYGAAALWTAGLLSVMSSSDSWDLGELAMPLLYVYFGALSLRLLVGAYRSALMRRWRREFERTRTPVEGIAVRKFTHTYSVSDADGSHQRTDHHVVVYSGVGDVARDLIVSERDYDAVQEGRTRARALPGWQTREPDHFELLP